MTLTYCVIGKISSVWSFSLVEFSEYDTGVASPQMNQATVGTRMQ